ncbi:hypothetical protein BT96DRAFT_999608 [Gymnopus androsaceus JB14]|uniref:DUF6534 domain-containing protein n=1 Tax=Gymnopus androsaceus JB14 TaxID=1447944 RepID=A0A6A4H694_9AGAR|nr:hypothetical protein BT96DRAFT_999608 [Gymnopus androsaceus JB14]
MSQPGLAPLIGPFVVGAYLNAILYGVLLVQAKTYFTVCKGDKLWVRYLVHFLIIAETVNVVIDFGLIWQPLITENGEISFFKRFATTRKKIGTSRALEVSPIALRADPVVTAVVSTVVEIYMGWRIRQLTSSNLLFMLIMFLAFSSLVGGVSSTIFVSLMPEYSRFREFQWAILTWLISSATADIVIAVSLVIYLVDKELQRQLRSNRYVTVQTGALTSIAAISDFLTFVLTRSTLQFIWDLPLGKFYTISLLSSLNARVKWQQMLTKDRTPSMHELGLRIRIPYSRETPWESGNGNVHREIKREEMSRNWF